MLAVGSGRPSWVVAPAPANLVVMMIADGTSVLVGFHLPAGEFARVASGARRRGRGFIAATGLLHGIGIGLGLYLQDGAARWLVRAGGVAVAATGLALLVT